MWVSLYNLDIISFIWIQVSYQICDLQTFSPVCVYLKKIFFLWPHNKACGILVPRPGIELRPSVKHRVLSTGMPGNSLCLFFYSLNRVFLRAKTFNFDEVQFIIFFSFTDCAFDIKSKNSLVNLRSWRFSLTFLLQVLCFTVWICDPFWVHIIIKCEVLVKIHLLHMDNQLSQHCLLKILSFLHWIAFACLSNINWPYLCRAVWTLFCSIDSCAYLFTNTSLSWLL